MQKEGIDYVICQVCGHKCGCINHLHLRSHGMSTAEYRELYPGAQLTCDATRMKRINSMTGQVRSSETKTKQSEAAHKRWSDPAERARNGAAVVQRYVDNPEARKVQSDNTKKQWENPVYRAIMVDSANRQWEDPDYRVTMSEMMVDLQKDGGFSTGYRHTDEAKQKIRDRFIGVPKTPEHCQHISDTHLDMSGPNNPNWKGGISSEQDLLRTSEEYAEWRKGVFERDDYTCQMCDVRGGNLNAHHIYPYADYSEPQFSLSPLNGITLCVKCHRKTFGKEYDYLSVFLDITMGVNT